jgi:Ca2+-binding EF-hand superfamily protein
MVKGVPVKTEKIERCMKQAFLDDKKYKRLWKTFCTNDRNLDGKMDRKDFFAWITENPSPFINKMFGLCDIDTDWEELTFEEWCTFVTVISILTEEELLKFLYFCYDKDKNGFLEMQEVEIMIEQLHERTIGGDLQIAMEQIVIPEEDDGRITWKFFLSIHREYPHLFFPIFKVLRTNSLLRSPCALWLSARGSRSPSPYN